MGPLGLPELIIIAVLLGLLMVPVVIVVVVVISLRRGKTSQPLPPVQEARKEETPPV